MMNQAVLRRSALASELEAAQEAVREAQRHLRSAEDAVQANRQVGQFEFQTKVRDQSISITAGKSILIADDESVYGHLRFTEAVVDLAGSTGVVLSGGDMSQHVHRAGYGLTIRIAESPNPDLVGKIYGVRAVDCTLSLSSSA